MLDSVVTVPPAVETGLSGGNPGATVAKPAGDKAGTFDPAKSGKELSEPTSEPPVQISQGWRSALTSEELLQPKDYCAGVVSPVEAEPSDVHRQTAEPSDIHRRAVEPSDDLSPAGPKTPEGREGWNQGQPVTSSADKKQGGVLHGETEVERRPPREQRRNEVMESIPTGERVVIGADFNGHVGEGNTGDEEVMGKFGVKERNLEGQMVVDFAKRMDMGVVNTYFQKREEHRVTYKSGGRRTQVDYILCRRGNLKEISDCKVVVGESVARQHRMVVCRMTLMVCKTKRSKIEKKTKWWKLKKEECCEEFRQKLRQALGGQVVLPDD
ncbi:hypothetical protein QTP86_012666 [Hemibagrus guttatus]|nr:hypothetical protein QTP86_012666 [Hemibagrus guttatus]